MKIKKIITVCIMSVLAMCASAAPDVTDVVAKQRYPWNGLVDITCKVSGINGTGNDHYFSVAAVMPDTGNAQKISHFWVVRNGTNSTDRTVSANGSYRLLWDASADLGQVVYDNMVMRVTVKTRNIVQLWEGGPYWADTNIGAEKPWESGYYFWWGDTVGYKCEGDAWVASDGSSSNFLFSSGNAPTHGKSISTLQSEGWIVSQDGTYVLALEHDAAQVQWGGGWRMPTDAEFSALISNCTATWITTNGVSGRLVTGKGAYANRSIFLPAAGSGHGSGLYSLGSYGYCWSSTPRSGNSGSAWFLYFGLSYFIRYDDYYYRYNGQSVRPVRGSAP